MIPIFIKADVSSLLILDSAIFSCMNIQYVILVKKVKNKMIILKLSPNISIKEFELTPLTILNTMIIRIGVKTIIVPFNLSNKYLNSMIMTTELIMGSRPNEISKIMDSLLIFDLEYYCHILSYSGNPHEQYLFHNQ